MIRYIFIFLLFVSCNGLQKKDSTINNNQRVTPKDTVITYNLEGVSTEGAQVEVNYKSGKISKSETIVYGETGKAIIVYEFENNRIKVFETRYSYKTNFENVKSDDDIQLSKEQIYYLDYNGNVIEGTDNERVDIFQEFKRDIPFSVK